MISTIDNSPSDDSIVMGPGNAEGVGDDFPKEGLSMWYILNVFLPDVCGGKVALQGLTTTQVRDRIILPKTEKERCSFCTLIKNQHGCQHPPTNTTPTTSHTYRYYGEEASVFISHAHSYLFLDVISALEWHFQGGKSDEQDTIIWIDLFSINQHVTHVWNFEWLSTTFRSAIGHFGRTIMILSPWNNPLPFTRAWCIFEAYCTAVTNGNFEIAMSRSDQELFLQDIRRDPKGCVEDMLANIRAKNSRCSLEGDRRQIFAAIRGSLGFAAIDAMVFERYREWVIQISSMAVKTFRLDDDGILLLDAIGILHQQQGKYPLAERYLKMGRQGRRQLYGVDSAQYQVSTTHLARLLQAQGKFHEAVDLAKDSFRQRKRLLGKDHVETLFSIHLLGELYRIQRRFDDAQVLLEPCLQEQQNTLGDDHPSTLQTLQSLGQLFFDHGNYTVAESYYLECLQRRKCILGDDHPATMDSQDSLAELYYCQGEPDKARPLFEQSLEWRLSSLGDDHPGSLLALNYLVCLHYTLGEHDEVRRLLPKFEGSMQKQKIILGESHPDTLTSIHNLATIYDKQGEYDKARRLYEECLQRRQITFGLDHPKTLNSLRSLTVVLEERLDRAIASFGEEHPYTLEMLFQLALLHKNHGQKDEARPLLEECVEMREVILGKDNPITRSTRAHLEELEGRIADCIMNRRD